MKIEELVIATRNAHKADEIRPMLSDLPIAIKDLRDYPDCPEVEEDGETLEQNALKKARSAHAHTGRPVIADDTGLEVYYLLGEPGVYSARYAGESATYDDNNRKLLLRMTQVPERKRHARFRCVIALVGAGGEHTFEGVVEGKIGFSPRGAGGFGYDPIFFPIGSSQSYAELSMDEKNSISHRGRAIAALHTFLSSLKP